MKKPRKPTHVWVVEVLSESYEWMPYLAGVTREQGLALVRFGQKCYPDKKFRFYKYVPERKVKK